MKKLSIITAFLISSLITFGQQTSTERDSVARDQNFQLKVKMKALSAANDLLADPNQPTHVIQYAQLIISQPNGENWLPALSYGVITNPAVNYDSSEGDIQFTINSIFVKYAKAYYRIVE